jgi:hypothetical protein
MVALMVSIGVGAQKPTILSDSTLFKGYFDNKDYNIYLRLDAYLKNITVPGQDIYGELPGYLGDNQDSRKWLFISSEVVDKSTLRLSIINEYGSEDLMATLKQEDDTTFVLKKESGSMLKIARNGKWQKLPKKITFYKRKPKE